MAHYDHQQAPRLGQRTSIEQPGIRQVTSDALPESPYEGQLVWVKDLAELRVYTLGAWLAAGGSGTQSSLGPTPPDNPNVGDLWINTSDNDKLYTWNGTQWVSPTSGGGSDGVAPSSSPTPTIIGGIGTLFVQFTAIVNADPVTYDIHISTLNGFTPSLSTKAVSAAATSVPIRTLPDNTPLQNGTVYYVKVVARDADGSAPASSQASGQMTLIHSVDFAPGSVDAPALADFIVTARKLNTNTHVLY